MHLHQFGVPGQALDEIGLLRAARHMGLKARRIRSRWTRLRATLLPAIAVQKYGSYVILARMDGATVLVQDPREGRPAVRPRVPFEEAWSGDLILMGRRDRQPLGTRPFVQLSWY